MIAAQQLDTLNPQQMRQALELLLADVAAKDELIRQRERGTLLLGQARGAAVAALVAADLPVAEYTALQLKKAVVGHGLANKAQVQAMVQRLLALPGLPGKDAADALGLAITHAHAGASLAALARATPLQRRAHAQYRKGRVY